MKRLSLSALFVFALSLPVLAEEAAAPAAAKASVPKSGGKTIAVVNNEPIFASELENESGPFIERFLKTAPEKDQTPEKIAQLKKEILDRLIEERLLLQEAKNKKVKVLKTEIERGMEQFKEPFLVDEKGKQRDRAQVEKAFQDQLLKEGLTQDGFNKRVEEQVMKVKLIEQDVKSKVEMPRDLEVKDFFSKIQDKIAGKPVKTETKEEEADLAQISKYLQRMAGEQMRIRHILIRSAKAAPVAERAAAKKKLDDILVRIKSGEDFAFLAKKYTDDPLSRDRGGDLGFVAMGDMGLPEIDTVIFKLKEGDVSPVIETEIGYHVVKVVEKKAPHPLELEEVADDLKNYMAQKVFTSKLEKYLKDLRVKASVKVNAID